MEDAYHAIPMKSAKCDNSSSASKPKTWLGILMDMGVHPARCLHRNA